MFLSQMTSLRQYMLLNYYKSCQFFQQKRYSHTTAVTPRPILPKYSTIEPPTCIKCQDFSATTSLLKEKQKVVLAALKTFLNSARNQLKQASICVKLMIQFLRKNNITKIMSVTH